MASLLCVCVWTHTFVCPSAAQPLPFACIVGYCSVSRARSMSPTPPGRKRPSPAAEPPVPSQKLAATARHSSDELASAAPLWEDVADPEGSSTYDVMRRTIPFVQYHLSAMYNLGPTGIVGAAPLRIDSAGGKGAGGQKSMEGYKESWCVENCCTSIKRTGLYEAGGNLAWVDTSLGTAGTPEDVLFREEPGWSVIRDYADQFFSESAATAGVSAATAGVSAASAAAAAAAGVSAVTSRLLFPGEALDTFVRSAADVEKSMPSKVTLIGGHAMVWAWYYAVARAVKSSNNVLIGLLWQCALTCTIRVRVETDNKKILLAAVRLSESYISHEKGMSDTFVGWADKALEVAGAGKSAQAIADALNKMGVTYQGGQVKKQMVLAAQTLRGMLSGEVRRALQVMERKFGREILSNSYAKLQMMARLAKQSTSTSEDAVALLLFVLQAMHFAMERGFAPPKWFTQEVIDKNKHDQSPGWFHMTVAKRTAVRHVLNLTACVPDMDPSHAESVSRALSSFVQVHERFPALSASVSCEDGDTARDDAQESEGPSGAPEEAVDKFHSFCEALPKPIAKAAEVLHGLYLGVYDPDLKVLAKKDSATEALNQMDADMGDLSAQLREFMRMASSSTCSVGPPGLSLRQLARIGSESGVTLEEKKEALMKERDELWKRARAQRQKFVQFAHWKNKTKEGLEALLSRAQSIAGMSGKLNESHRGFMVSMDLIQESDVSPWLSTMCPKGGSTDAILSFATSREGGVDFVFCFDGRNREARRRLEDSFEKARKPTEEVWIVYSGKSSAPGSRSRKVCMAANTKEALLLKLPCPRVRLNTKSRELFNAAGESSTHDSTWTAVPALSAMQLPRLPAAEKRKIFKEIKEDAEMQPPKWPVDGVPLFWNEVKPLEFWVEFLRVWDLHAIMDLTPGSGTLAGACMKLGIQYLGVCADPVHLSWLHNTCDKAAIQHIIEQGSPLYHSAELSELLRAEFADVLDELNEQTVGLESDDGDEY